MMQRMASRRSPQSRTATLFSFLLVHAWSIAVLQAVPQAGATGDAALRGFRASLDSYVALRTRIRGEVPPLQVTPDAKEIAQRSDALSNAIIRGRQNVRAGQFFDTAAAAAIRQSLAAALKSSDDAAIRALLDADMTTFTGIKVHARFPVGYLLPTTPPTLLQALPPLPPQLEYRFIGRTLVLRDIDAALIIDYLVNALPPR
jgi:hypothetical protein